MKNISQLCLVNDLALNVRSITSRLQRIHFFFNSTSTLLTQQVTNNIVNIINNLVIGYGSFVLNQEYQVEINYCLALETGTR